jgi:phosphatidylserine/phosphatidylglycerophosphate/cardiolipin synthase-like enzyme
VGKTVAFRYDKGSAPGKMRAVNVFKAKGNRLMGKKLNASRSPLDDHTTYYTHFMSDIRMHPADAEVASVTAEGELPPPLLSQQAVLPRRSGTSGAGRSRSLAVAKNSARDRARSASRFKAEEQPVKARAISDVQSDPDSRSAGSHATVGKASNLVAIAAAAAPPVVTRSVECYNLPHFANSAVLELAFKSDVEELVGKVIPYCQRSLWIACYVYEGFYNVAIEQRARAGVACKMVCDRNKLFQVGSGLRMQQAMLCLLDWGVEIRHNLPGQGNIMSAQHQKTWLVDGGLLLYGSHNLSKNSARNADELLCATSVKSACDSFANHFEWLWDRSIAVGARELHELIDKHVANKEVKAEEHRLTRQRSQSLMRGGD